MLSSSPLFQSAVQPLGTEIGPWLLLGALLLAFLIQIYFAIAAVRRDRDLTPIINEARDAQRDVDLSASHIVDAVVRALATADAGNERVRHDLRQLESAFSHLRHALDARETELQNLRTGYEVLVAKRLMGRVVRAAHAIRALRDSNPGLPQLTDAANVLEDALEDAGIESFEPRAGSDFRTSSDMDDGPLLEFTADPTKDYLLARVVRPGYRMQQADGTIAVLSKARVAIYRHQDTNA